MQPGHTQTLHVHTAPKAALIYDSFYSDGHDGAVYGGSSTGGQADASGNYDATWTVLPTAPLGKVRVDIVAAGKVAGQPESGSREVTYVLKAAC